MPAKFLEIRANISGGSRVYRGVTDEATAPKGGLAESDRGSIKTEAAMISGWTKPQRDRDGFGRLAGQSASPLPVYPMRL